MQVLLPDGRGAAEDRLGSSNCYYESIMLGLRRGRCHGLYRLQDGSTLTSG